MQKVLVAAVALAMSGAIALGARREMVPRPGDAAVGALALAPAGAAAAGPLSGAPEPSAAGAAPTSPSTAGARQQSADAILRRAAAAYRGVRSLRASFLQVVRNPLLGGAVTSRGTLYQRRPDRFLMKFAQPAGDVLVSDGRWFWVYYPSVDPKQVIRTPASAAGQAVDLQAQFLGDPERRFNARLEGRQAVAGRQAYVLSLTPRGSEPFKALKLWIDPTDYLARRFEITEENGSVRHIDLSDLRVNVPAGDALFRFTPPAGAHIVTRG